MDKFEFSFLLLLLLSVSQVSSFKCQESERKALLKFKQSFIDDSNRLASWEADQDCCKWEGINCQNPKGAVTSLDLRCNTADSCTALQAFKLDSSLLELKHLQHLDLSGNNFNGIQIPPFIGSMNELQYLNLSLAKFGGKVPHQLGNLTNLRVLDLFSSGDIPMKADKLEWTFGLHNLQFLDMSAIDLSQAFDSIQVLHKLPSLLHLRLSDCLLNNTHFTQTFLNSTRHLQFLDMSNNLFDGPTPTTLANLSSIRFLDLSFNYLSSSLPYWLQAKRNLQVLNLAGNNLDGVEGGILSLLGRLCGLKSLDLSFNHITDGISDSQVDFSICSEYSLETMYLNVNNITGQLSIWLENFKHLRYIDVGSNSFSGGISVSFDVLSSLQHFDSSNNRFSGNIPTSIGRVSSLEWLDLSNNHFIGVVNEVNFANLSRLTYLDLSLNSLALEMGSNWHPKFQLQTLILRSLKMNTPFPYWVQTQKKISSLDLSNVGIFGSLPDNLNQLFPSLNSFNLANNLINGSIPQSLCKLTNLQLIDLGNNQLTGMIPDCWNDSQSLQVLDFSSNKLSGPLPTSLSKVASLESLSLNNNKLTGELPIYLTNWTNLVIFDVGENILYEKIPPWDKNNFPALQVLRLRGNNLKGSFPPQLCSLRKLQIIDIADNKLSGTIPECIGSFSAMISLQVVPGPINVGPFPAQGSVTEVVKGGEHEYTANLGLFVNMDLSSNNLVGIIPNEVTNLHSLVGLNLSYNNLSGPIPETIGQMKSLESLDLSNNHLSGMIPKSMSAINTLEHMNLSYNNLHGQIPTGNQLQTLDDPSIYIGNPGLCGDPLPEKCGDDGSTNGPARSTDDDDDDDDSKHEDQWFFIAMPIGFVTGFWGVVGVLFVNKRMRTVYFKLADDVADYFLG